VVRMRHEVKERRFAVLVLLAERFYDVRYLYSLSWRHIYTKLHGDPFRHSSIIKVITSTTVDPTVAILREEHYEACPTDGISIYKH
jgi:hypothetical protein